MLAKRAEVLKDGPVTRIGWGGCVGLPRWGVLGGNWFAARNSQQLLLGVETSLDAARTSARATSGLGPRRGVATLLRIKYSFWTIRTVYVKFRKILPVAEEGAE